MNEITLFMPIHGKNVTANVTEEELTLSKIKQKKKVWSIPAYVSPTINNNSVSYAKMVVNRNQKALLVNGSDFRLHYNEHPLAYDIGSTLLEDLRGTAEQRYHTKDIVVRLDLDDPTCFIFGKPNNSTGDNTAPLENVPKALTSIHHHNEPAPSTTPTTKPTMPVNNESLIRKQYERMIARIIQEYEDKVEELKKELRKQRHRHEIELSNLDKQYKRQLTLQNQQKQPQIQLPKSNQRIADWVQHNWKVLEPTFKQYASAMYSSQNERQHGGEDGKGDNYEADKYKKQAQDIMTMSLNEYFKRAKQKHANKQPTKDNQKSEDEELDK